MSTPAPNSLAETRQLLAAWLSAVADVVRGVNTAEPLDVLLSRIAEQACRLIGFDICAVMLVNASGHWLQHRGAHRRGAGRGAGPRRGRRDRHRRAAGRARLLEQAGGDGERALPGGALYTGAVGYMDDQGWFYIVDRKKDQINAGGFKVWPREVEDVLYEHAAVREAAVVGVIDPYRGETVKAFVSLRPGRQVDPDELIAFCKQRMAAYKYPRLVEILDEIPKTTSGKVLRRELRDRPVAGG